MADQCHTTMAKPVITNSTEVSRLPAGMITTTAIITAPAMLLPLV